MQEEINSLHENHTYDLVKLLNGKKSLQNKWVFHLKHYENSSHPKYTTRVRFHSIRGVLDLKLLKFEKIHNSKNGTDTLAKGLTKEKQVFCDAPIPPVQRRHCDVYTQVGNTLTYIH